MVTRQHHPVLPQLSVPSGSRWFLWEVLQGVLTHSPFWTPRQARPKECPMAACPWGNGSQAQVQLPPRTPLAYRNALLLARKQ